MLHPAENFQKHILRSVSRVGWVIYDAVDEAIDGLVELANQPGIGLFRTRLQFSDDGGFLGSGPDSAGKIAQYSSSRHNGVAPNYRITRGPGGNLNFVPKPAYGSFRGKTFPLKYLDSDAGAGVP